MQLCWFQVSSLLSALPLHHMITTCLFRVAALSDHTALAFFANWHQNSTVCCLPLLIKWRGYQLIGEIPLGFPSTASTAQLYCYHHQSGNAASSRLICKQHYMPVKQRHSSLMDSLGYPDIVQNKVQSFNYVLSQLMFCLFVCFQI